MRNVTTKVADPRNPGSLSHRARQRRWEKLLESFPQLGDMNVLDLGGTAQFWEAAPRRPAHVTTVNLNDVPSDSAWITQVEGDACVHDVVGNFDLVVSNSLLEHVGGHWRRAQLAEAVHRSAERHWVQTPYRFFPLEPHWVAPGMQWMPVTARAAVSRWWPIGHIHSPTHRDSMEDVLDVELLCIQEMEHYFPASNIWYERYLGMVKSLVAIKS